ncbi:hypothetical protein PG994_001090 [Apiospora phragmitis]|uniref:Uncharacterized protein n=1 Tax=Apiospora phragmitis TaxID=2905665 RepID=A0ABR1WSI1_9PEZI
MICCTDSRVRNDVESSIRQSGILYVHPEFGLGACALPLQAGLGPARTEECDFDGQSDEEEDEEDWEATTRGSLTPTTSPPPWAEDHHSESSNSPYSSQSSHPVGLEPTHSLESLEGHPSELEEPRDRREIQVVSLSLEPTLRGDGLKSKLDYVLLPLGGEPKAMNKIELRDPTRSLNLHVPYAVEMPSRQRRVIAVTGSSGVIHGTLLPGSTYFRRADSATVQKLYAVQLQDAVVEGDCGSAVLDAQSGGFYGHIVGGCPYTETAYIVSAADIFHDLQERFGAGAVLVPPPPMVDAVNVEVLDELCKRLMKRRQDDLPNARSGQTSVFSEQPSAESSEGIEITESAMSDILPGIKGTPFTMRLGKMTRTFLDQGKAWDLIHEIFPKETIGVHPEYRQELHLLFEDLIRMLILHVEQDEKSGDSSQAAH